jgi:hypothetical protein
MSWIEVEGAAWSLIYAEFHLLFVIVVGGLDHDQSYKIFLPWFMLTDNNYIG